MDKIQDHHTRMFYIEQAIEHGWSGNIMVMHIETTLHKRQGQAVTNFKDKLPSPQSDLAHHMLKDPYIPHCRLKTEVQHPIEFFLKKQKNKKYF
jgi:predicted nuclease of restriction endonuclease-like (RecB) superfamily